MTKLEKNKETVGGTEDWAIISFDEEEDEARWTRLIEEIDGLINEAEKMEADYGRSLMENRIIGITYLSNPTEDNPF